MHYGLDYEGPPLPYLGISGLQPVGLFSLPLSNLDPNLDSYHPGGKTDEPSFNVCEWNCRRAESRCTLLLRTEHPRFPPLSFLAQI